MLIVFEKHSYPWLLAISRRLSACLLETVDESQKASSVTVPVALQVCFSCCTAQVQREIQLA